MKGTKMRKMLIVGAAMMLCLAACQMTPQRRTYTTLFGLENAVTASIDGYFHLVVRGQCRTNAVPTVSKAYNVFQTAMGVAVLAAKGDTNSIPPADLIEKGTGVIVLINKEKEVR